MKMHRLISVVTLLFFLPLATGCATSAITPVCDDLGAGAPVLSEEETIRIDSWIDVSGEEHDWKGFVTAVATDSLEFSREGGSMRMARSEVLALKTSRASAWGSIALGAAAVFVVVVIIAARNFHPLGDGWNVEK